MPFIREDKAKWIKEDYIPDWAEKIQPKRFRATEVPWINVPQLNQAISIET